KWDRKRPATAPLPQSWGRFQGLYLHGKRVVLSYTVGGVEVLEAPWAESSGQATAITRTLQVGPSSRRLHLLLCQFSGKRVEVTTLGGAAFFAGKEGDEVTALALTTPLKETYLRVTAEGRAELTLQQHKQGLRVKLLLWRGSARDLPRFAALVKASPAPADPATWTKPGPARWAKPVVTRGEVG